MEQTGQTGENQKIEKQSDLDDLKPMEATSIDLSKYDKSETTVATASKINMPSKFHDSGNADVLKVESAVLETIERKDENGNPDNIEIRASELFSLKVDEKGKAIGWSTSPDSNLMKFAKDLGIKEPEKYESLTQLVNDMVGRKVLLKVHSKEQDGRTREFLKFRY
jgi:hypothetical protein